MVCCTSAKLEFSHIPISAINRKHIKQILQQINESRGDSPHRFNRIRSYLMIIFNELIEYDVIENNPIVGISKRKTIHRLRSIPPLDTRKKINEFLKENYYQFWLFMQIFFHSGSRITELIMVKAKDVDLSEQNFRVIMRKGKQYKEVNKPIKNIALKYWLEALQNAKTEDYVFSKGLLPGPLCIKSYQITKRWYRLVKKKLKINYDFYSLKHLNLDQTAELIDLKHASVLASHSSTEITYKHYALNESKRQNDKLKTLTNDFTTEII